MPCFNGECVTTEYGDGEIVGQIKTFDSSAFSFEIIYKVKLYNCPKILWATHSNLGGLLFNENELIKKGDSSEKENDVCVNCNLV